MKAIRISRVSEKTGLSRASIYRRLKQDPQFPRSFCLGGNCTAWDEAEVDKWLEARKASRQLQDRLGLGS